MTPKFSSAHIISLLDLTSLSDNDTDETIITLCQAAQTPLGNVAAVCIYPRFVKLAKQLLKNTPIKIATVANFPHGRADLKHVLDEIDTSIAAGVDEVDLVIPYHELIAGTSANTERLLKDARAICTSQNLKVILETGELKAPALIKQASQLAIQQGADFIKTSTGKVSVNATPDAAKTMLEYIKTNKSHTGCKISGGVRNREQAESYLQLASDIMGAEWITPQHFRFGASSLLANLLAEAK